MIYLTSSSSVPASPLARLINAGTIALVQYRKSEANLLFSPLSSEYPSHCAKTSRKPPLAAGTLVELQRLRILTLANEQVIQETAIETWTCLDGLRSG